MMDVITIGQTQFIIVPVTDTAIHYFSLEWTSQIWLHKCVNWMAKDRIPWTEQIISYLSSLIWFTLFAQACLSKEWFTYYMPMNT